MSGTTIAINELTGIADNFVQVPLIIENAINLQSIDIILQYDTDLLDLPLTNPDTGENERIIRGEVTQEWQNAPDTVNPSPFLNFVDEDNGIIRLVLFNIETTGTETEPVTGSIVEIDFKLKADIPVDTVTPLAIQEVTLGIVTEEGAMEISSSESESGITLENGSITVIEKPNIQITETENSTNVEENGQGDSFDVVLNSQPLETVTVEFTTDQQLQAIEPLTFNAQDWNIPKTVVVNAIDDQDIEDEHESIINYQVTEDSDTQFLGISGSVIVGITDNDTINTNTNIDIDNNGDVNGSTDGLLLVRALNGVSPLFITRNALGDDAQRTDGQEIIDFVQELKNNQAIDIDNNGDINGSTDGLLLVRALNGVSPIFITRNALGDDAQRTDGQEIIDFVHSLIPENDITV